MMIQRIGESEFVKAFDNYNRSENFSVAGRRALFEYFEEIDGDMELDVIAICCDYSEYESLKDFQDDFGDEYETMRDIEDATTVIKIDDESFIIQNF